jgi:hypothetical protein
MYKTENVYFIHNSFIWFMIFHCNPWRRNLKLSYFLPESKNVTEYLSSIQLRFLEIQDSNVVVVLRTFRQIMGRYVKICYDSYLQPTSIL